MADMDYLGVDSQVVSVSSSYYKYELDVATTLAIARECQNEVHQMAMDHPDIANQDVSIAWTNTSMN
jgi:hypothetical protein